MTFPRLILTKAGTLQTEFTVKKLHFQGPPNVDPFRKELVPWTSTREDREDVNCWIKFSTEFYNCLYCRWGELK